MRRLGLLCLATLLAASGCNPHLAARPADAQAIEALFPLIEELGVDAYWVDDECRYLHYARGSFSNDTTPDGSCRVWGFPDPARLDDQANRDIDRLTGAIRDAHLSVSYFSIEHDGDDPGVGRGSYFEIFPCDSLVFDPGYVALPSVEPAPEEVVVGAVTSNWYEIASAC